MELTYEKLVDLRKTADNYKTVGTFVDAHKKLSYIQFDYALTHELALFMMEPDFSFEALDDKLNAIIKTLPAIKRIFAQPSIHLKEQDVILPTESVRIINNNTIQHVSSHSELWSDIKNGEITPSRLLTRTYEDNYGIYENIVFCQTVDDILSFVRTNTRFLQEMIYANRTIEINLLERVNHLNYFLALGKLHIGYSRSFESYYADAARCLTKLQILSNNIVPRLKRPVYKNNRGRAARIKVRKTNILSMHKEYHQIYRLAKFFEARSETTNVTVNEKDLANLQKDYFNYCQALCVFAITHFNLTCKEDKLIDFSRLNITFKFKKWTAKLEKITRAKRQLLLLTINKDTEYKILIAPSTSSNNEESVREIRELEQADEYAVFTPYDEDEDNATLVDIGSIESFRRIQQIVLRGMIHADDKREECPFCSGKLTQNEQKSYADNSVYECPSCRTEIHDKTCPTTGKRYVATRIAGLTKSYDDNNDDMWLAKRKQEAQMYFRNITRINEDMDVVCPVCGGVHG